MMAERAVRLVSVAKLRWLALAMLLFLLLTQVGLHPFQDLAVSLQRSEGETDKQVALGGLVLLLALLTWNGRNWRSNLAMPATLLALLGYCALSSFWSIDPAITVRRLGLTVLASWFVCMQVKVLGYRSMLQVLRWSLLVLLAASYLAVLFLPSGVHHFVIAEDPNLLGNWKGVFAHKNLAGAACALTVILLVFDWQSFGRGKSLAGIAAALLFLFFTHSRTSEAALVVALVAGWGAKRLGGHDISIRVFLMAIGGVMLMAAGLSYERDFINSLNDPNGFTGRSTIWRLLLEYARNHLWTGAGFGSFWQIGQASPIWDYDNGWVATYAAAGHNGYLDLLVTIGLPGLALAVVVMFVLPMARLWNDPTIPAAERGLLVTILTFSMVHNLSESSLLDRLALVYLFQLFAVAAIHYDRAPGLVWRATVQRLRARVRLR